MPKYSPLVARFMPRQLLLPRPKANRFFLRSGLSSQRCVEMTWALDISSDDWPVFFVELSELETALVFVGVHVVVELVPEGQSRELVELELVDHQCYSMDVP
ncbi:hypothetical protein P171DRAFT_130858 [Karstenula rhodostoma CBS 690.94]|uniref:Uncharacterized protein n=1 Tax=Karstenula rhodostoma CBS 690.94 TaxID=1392251 RepID=A0A9P4P636_9PLEO|nr:hypothetical protein P171DRAFT_130858 [Karstenula rhodostoma CBS 690.94]